MNTKPIYVSQTDSRLIRLRLPLHLAEKRLREAALRLQEELDRAVVVNDSARPDDVVALRSHVELEDLESGERERYTLVLPGHGGIVDEPLSVFSPLGTALLGYAAGDEIVWTMPGGLRRLRLLAVTRPVETGAAS